MDGRVQGKTPWGVPQNPVVQNLILHQTNAISVKGRLSMKNPRHLKVGNS